MVAPVLLAACVLLLARCGPATPPGDYVARVHDAYLTQAELSQALEPLSPGRDSVEAREQLVERWIMNELLHQEALRRNLRGRQDVQRRLAESERAVLIDALVADLYESETVRPTPAEIQAYYERHKNLLRLREPFVQVRYLATPVPDSAETVRAQLEDDADEADLLWLALVEQHAQDPAASTELSASYYPESRVFAEQPVLRAALGELEEGRSTVVEVEGLYHMLQLVRRIPAETLPELEWVKGEITQRLAIESRKHMYARQVQRLRTEAQARDALEIR